MAKSINKVILVGRLGRDPELKYTANGVPFCRFSMATDDSWNDKNSGERQERTEWHNIVAWDRLAEICNQYLTKGKLVYIEGALRTREWDDQDGNKRKTTEILARDMMMLSGSGENTGNGYPRRTAADAAAGSPSAPASAGNPGGKGGAGGSGGAGMTSSTITDDDIPF
jgi:single-strand DNA-binding protein